MFLLFGSKTRAKPISGGMTVERRCEDCEGTTLFRECDVKDRFTVFFVEVTDSTQRRLVCTECGHDVEVPQARRVATASTVARTSTAATPPKRRLGDREKDDLLAQLKKKMNK